MAKITKIEALIPAMPAKKRVAAYARVSRDSERLMHSLSAQISYYSSLIQKNPDWEYAGVYADEGISGTSRAGRDEFNRLIADCEAGRIDMILTKSISRFARNTVDLLETIRHLKDLGVEVKFERENIRTFSGDGELMLSILASFAQEESKSLSDNIKWSIKKKFEEGESHAARRCFGYDWDSENNTCVIKEEEAVWVRYIYKRYLDGASIRQIAKELADRGITGLRGAVLGRDTVRRILTQEIYTGDLILQQFYSLQIRKPELNRGEEPKYNVEEDHPAIVSKSDFQKVQERIAQRAAEYSHVPVPHLFTGMVRCGKCGSPCCYFARKSEENAVIACEKQVKGNCDLLLIRESELQKACEEISTAADKPQCIVLFDDRIEFTMGSGRVQTVQRDFPFGANRCFSGKIVCSFCGRTFLRYRSGNHMVWRCGTKCRDRNACSVRSIPEDELIEAAKSMFDGGNYEIRFHCEVEKVLVFNSRLDFIFKGGESRTWERR